MHKLVNSSDEVMRGSKLGTEASIARRSNGSNLGSSADGTDTPTAASTADGGDNGGIGSASSVSKSRRSSRAKSIKSDNESRKSRHSSLQSGLEKLMTDEFGHVKFSGYNINKWVLYHHFDRDVRIIKQKVSELYKTSDTGEESESRTTSAKDVSDYWENTLETSKAPNKASSKAQKRKLNAMETQALLILQCQFRLWLELARMRRHTQYNGFDMHSKIGTVQNAIRRFYAIREVKQKEAKQLLSADLFSEFCTLMVAGVPLLMYSRKHGTAVKRTIKFTDGMCVYAYLYVCMYVAVYILVSLFNPLCTKNLHTWLVKIVNQLHMSQTAGLLVALLKSSKFIKLANFCQAMCIQKRVPNTRIGVSICTCCELVTECFWISSPYRMQMLKYYCMGLLDYQSCPRPNLHFILINLVCLRERSQV